MECTRTSPIVTCPAGVVKSTKMTRTIVVRRDYLHYIKKYARCAAQQSRFSLVQQHLSSCYIGYLLSSRAAGCKQICSSSDWSRDVCRSALPAVAVSAAVGVWRQI